MAKKPDGKAAGIERVAFTRSSAERIKDVVLKVERGNRDCGPLSFGARAAPSGGSQVKFATYTATAGWPVVSFTTPTTGTNAMTIRFLANTGVTAVCLNHLAWLPKLGTVSTVCIRTIVVMKEAGQWRLMGAQA